MHGPDRVTKFHDELDSLEKILHFPEEVALRLCDIEYELFYDVPAIQYLEQGMIY